ncbi:phosphotransferase [uncultured Maribacter sp.]|uniref:phosphotransferase n=1 Tax=uncultured Maribacter sp. TaxID=431308 RepID=UPI0030D9E5E9
MIQISEDSSYNSLENYLTNKHWIEENERITKITKAGEGNMNVVLRVTTDISSIVIKQSRPFVQKYQDIPAPVERIVVENYFYEAIGSGVIKENTPTIIGFDPESYILAMEDIGDCDDMNLIYHERTINTDHFEKLITIIHQIHNTATKSDFPANMKMRELNHQHIFVLPFLTDNGFSLDDIQIGLQELSMPFKENEDLKKQVSLIGEKYLSKGNTLLHGDYYPGSWMSKNDHLYIIDPEFGFIGFPEFDLGVMAGHLIMATNDTSYIEKIEKTYPTVLDSELLKKITGIEIMRRLIGLAQLPLSRTLVEKEQLLLMSKNMILS